MFSLFRKGKNPDLIRELYQRNETNKLATLELDACVDLSPAARQKTKEETANKEIQEVAVFNTIFCP